MSINLQARYDLICVKSAIKTQPTNLAVLKLTIRVLML